jgi:hypothetical protein
MSAWNRTRSWLLLAGVLALLPVCALFLTAADRPAADLTLVPADAAGFLTVRVADVVASQPGKDLLATLPAAAREALKEGETRLGLTPRDVDRVTIVLRTLHPAFITGAVPKTSPEMYVVFNLSKAADQKKILDHVLPESRSIEHNGKKFALREQQDEAVYFHDDRTIVAGTASGVKKAIDQAVKPTVEGPLAAALGQVNQHHLALGVVPPAEVAKFAQAPQSPFPALADVRSVLLTGLLNGQALGLELSLAFSTPDRAAEGKKQLDAFLTVAKTLPEGAIKDLPQPVQKMIWQGIENLKSSQIAANVVVTSKGDLSPELFKVLLPGVIGANPNANPIQAANRVKSQNNLKQMALAFLNYESANGKFSWGIFTPNVPVAQQKPLLSWRVALLPYLEQGELYTQIKLDEPWDSEHNSKFHKLMPKIFEVPGKQAVPGMTYYQTFVGPGAIFEKNSLGRKIAGITDGTSNTLLVVEAAKPVNWMKPDDIDFAVTPNGFPVEGKVGGHFDGGFHAAFADGSVRFLPLTLKPLDFQALITAAGGEVIKLP